MNQGKIEPPRKCSVASDHPYFTPDLPVVRVWVNGIEQKNVVTYDQDEGWVEQHREGEDGQFYRVNDEFVVDRINGDVTVKYAD